MKQQKYKCLHKLIWLGSISLLLLSFIPKLFPDYWYTDIFSNFKLQYLIASVFCLVIVWFLFRRKILVSFLLILSIGFNAYYILPYYFNTEEESIKIEDHLKIVSINLLSSNTKVDLVEAYISKENPDLIVLMEFTPQWKRLLQKTISAYSFNHLEPRNDNFGNAILSKNPIEAKTDYFQHNQKPSIVSQLNLNNKLLTIIATHPLPPLGKHAFELRNQHMDYLIKNRSKFSDHLVVAGDFNNSSYSNHFQKLLKSDLKDSRLGFGLLPTWPASISFLRTTLDHILVSENIKVLDRTVGENIGSDHLPISVEIGF
ncbi:endonuclease/exonuclease/phosphatase family protein [Mesonia sp.]|uniref:endonuclease/exonuclease/phosphatase family protein n=1 Tax=Mesonia sp. TaxID=1960830 RepID=UPI0017788FA8|nr:endonuclease/exonuclease/phosphatase family protein [Mesonia sp.]HIB36912.1 endonuclease/exonuclease/phosphatase family protein [Mesonia sp.]HIO26771.1 endonuclease/exonuclease/phosphatase family protein [Flavobacteriaceae bacterium]